MITHSLRNGNKPEALYGIPCQTSLGQENGWSWGAQELDVDLMGVSQNERSPYKVYKEYFGAYRDILG